MKNHGHELNNVSSVKEILRDGLGLLNSERIFNKMVLGLTELLVSTSITEIFNKSFC